MESPSTPRHWFVFSFEETFDGEQAFEWMRQWWHHSFFYVAAYFVVILSLRATMKSRPAFNLRPVLFAWDTIHAVFSACGLCRVLPEMVHTLSTHGFTYSVCNASASTISIYMFWMWLMAFSKLIEFGDTLFIVLRKRKLTFLHMYHHAFVLVFSWYCFRHRVAVARWFVTMNYFVHMMMYSYYALKATGVKFPRVVPMAVTSSQMLQLVLGCIVTCYAYFVKKNGEDCHLPDLLAYCAVIVYLSLVVLFVRYFYFAYITPKSKKIR